jgi:hypothetical protein
VLGEVLPVVPEKLVRKILKGDFMDMAELLKDNVEAERRQLARQDVLCGVLNMIKLAFLYCELSKKYSEAVLSSPARC